MTPEQRLNEIGALTILCPDEHTEELERLLEEE